MKKLLFTLLTLIAFNAFSQTPEIKSPGKIALGFTFSPDYSYRALNSDPDIKWVADSRDDREIPKFGFTTGARVLFTLGNKVSLESGLLFADKGEKTKKLRF